MTVRTETMAASRTGAAVSALNMDVKDVTQWLEFGTVGSIDIQLFM